MDLWKHKHRFYHFSAYHTPQGAHRPPGSESGLCRCCSLHRECSQQPSLSFPPTWILFLLQGIVNSLCCNSEVWAAVSLGEPVLTMSNLCALLSHTKPSGLLAHCAHDAVQTLDSPQELYLQGAHSLLDKQTAVKYQNEPDHCCLPLTGHGLCYQKERVDCQSIQLPGRMGLCPNHTFALLASSSSVLTVFPPSWSVLHCPNAGASYFFLL